MPATDFVAVATKLLVPERRRGMVERPELIRELEEGRRRLATVVVATALRLERACRVRKDENAA